MRATSGKGNQAVVTEDHYRQLEKAVDVIWWFQNWVYTQDQHRPDVSARPFPSYKDNPALYKYIETLNTCRRVAIAKSRQMMISWVTTAFLLHDAMFKNNRFNFFISEKQRKANNLLARAKFVYIHQPIPRQALDCLHTVSYQLGDIGTKSILPFYSTKEEVLKSGASHIKSKLEAFSEEGDDIRMETASNVFIDEMAFLVDAKKVLRAVKPTLGIEGKLFIASTPRGRNDFYNIIHDIPDTEVI